MSDHWYPWVLHYFQHAPTEELLVWINPLSKSFVRIFLKTSRASLIILYRGIAEGFFFFSSSIAWFSPSRCKSSWSTLSLSNACITDYSQFDACSRALIWILICRDFCISCIITANTNTSLLLFLRCRRLYILTKTTNISRIVLFILMNAINISRLIGRWIVIRSFDERSSISQWFIHSHLSIISLFYCKITYITVNITNPFIFRDIRTILSIWPSSLIICLSRRDWISYVINSAFYTNRLEIKEKQRQTWSVRARVETFSLTSVSTYISFESFFTSFFVL